jgi:hypothetical protein
VGATATTPCHCLELVLSEPGLKIAGPRSAQLGASGNRAEDPCGSRPTDRQRLGTGALWPLPRPLVGSPARIGPASVRPRCSLAGVLLMGTPLCPA